MENFRALCTGNVASMFWNCYDAPIFVSSLFWCCDRKVLAVYLLANFKALLVHMPFPVIFGLR